jgi:hypothetical protein
VTCFCCGGSRVVFPLTSTVDAFTLSTLYTVTVLSSQMGWNNQAKNAVDKTIVNKKAIYAPRRRQRETPSAITDDTVAYAHNTCNMLLRKTAAKTCYGAVFQTSIAINHQETIIRVLPTESASQSKKAVIIWSSLILV